MEFARSFVDRFTSRAILPMITLGISGAIAILLLDVASKWKRVALRANSPEP